MSTARKVRPSALVCKRETVYAWASVFRCPILKGSEPFLTTLGTLDMSMGAVSPVLRYLVGLVQSVHLPGANGRLLTFQQRG